MTQHQETIDVFMKHATNMIIPNKAKNAVTYADSHTFIRRAICLDGIDKVRIATDSFRIYYARDCELTSQKIETINPVTGEYYTDTESNGYPLARTKESLAIGDDRKTDTAVSFTLTRKRVSTLRKQLRALKTIMKADGIHITPNVIFQNVGRNVHLRVIPAPYESEMTLEAFDLFVASIDSSSKNIPTIETKMNLEFVIDMLTMFDDMPKNGRNDLTVTVGNLRVNTTSRFFAPALYVSNTQVDALILGIKPV